MVCTSTPKNAPVQYYCMQLLFYHKLKKIRSDGRAPIYLRITIAGKRAELATGISVTADQWHEKKVVGCAQAAVFNERLSIIERDTWKIYNNADTATLTAAQVKFRFIQMTAPRQQQTFTELLDEHIRATWERTRARRNASPEITEITARSAEIRATVLKKFIAEKRIYSVHEITHATGEALKDWMAAKHYAPNYIQKVVQLLIRIMENCVRRGLVLSNQVAGIRVKRPAPVKTYLLEPVLHKMLAADFPRLVMQKTADMAIVQAYTGFAFTDLVKVERAHVVTLHGRKWLIDFRRKSGEMTVIPFFPEAEKIFEKYNYRLPIRTNGLYNRYLKELADLMGLQLKLTTHVFRRTFGQHRLNEGIGIAAVSRMMGHQDVRTTLSKYVTVTPAQMADELDRVRVNRAV